MDLPPFTLIGATTRAGMLSNPLRARFGITGHMEYYELDDLTEIVERTADIFEMEIAHEAAIELARRSRARLGLPIAFSSGCGILPRLWAMA